MKTVSERALFERAKRSFAKDGLYLSKHKAGNRDTLMNGKLYAYSLNDNNVVNSYWDYDGFVKMCRSENILKDDEEIEK